MKQFIAILVFFNLFLMVAHAQQPQPAGATPPPPPPSANAPREDHQKMEAARIGYITKRLDLTTDEAQKFWPIYNEAQAELKKLHEANKPSKKIEDMTDAEADKLLAAKTDMQKKKIELELTYRERFKKVLSSKKVALLETAETNFRQQVFSEMRNRHDKFRRGGRD
jgi:Spy/CpxP family protein refolding chaperone